MPCATCTADDERYGAASYLSAAERAHRRARPSGAPPTEASERHGAGRGRELGVADVADVAVAELAATVAAPAAQGEVRQQSAGRRAEVGGRQHQDVAAHLDVGRRHLARRVADVE